MFMEFRSQDWILHNGDRRNSNKWSNFSYHIRTNLLIFLVLLLILGSKSVSGDGVMVIYQDYQALKAMKHDFIDLKGVLRSWNGSRRGVCSGGWQGIKCVNGEVITIQLPWKGLGGRISEKIGQLKSLRRISLHDNFLGGSLPNSLGSLPNLRGVYLFNNRLSGSIPPSIGNCPSLQHLDISKNQLNGTIPPNLVNSTRIYRLNLSFNAISGSIPISFTHFPTLTFLALQHNNLSGSIPNTWGVTVNHSYQLQSLTLDHNFLSGHIPTSLSKLGNLEEIKLNHNQIDGKIPDSLANLPNLTSFDVSNNNLSGIVPSDLIKKFNSSSFVGNTQLCGYSAKTPCPSSSPPPQELPSPPPQASKNRKKKVHSTKNIILIAAGALLLVLLLLCCILLCCLIRKRAKSKAKEGNTSGQATAKSVPTVGAEAESGGDTGGKLVHFDGPFVFTADDLLCATAEIMGKSTYGTAYKATMEDGDQVAVKRLREKIAKGPKEFEAEVAILGKIRHQNILALRAYYMGPKGEKLLVFDYMANGSLASFLHARGPETAIPWPTRMKIAMGITKGLCFLHSEENIIHGNLTSSNILLDEQNNPAITDVGLSRLMTNTANTNVIATAGTQGYCAPELSKLKNATTKTDVYSLGVIILELLTGKSPSEGTDGIDLPQWVASIVKEEWTNEVFDLELMGDASNSDELLNTLKLALHCVDPSPAARPEAQEVLQKLEEIKPELATGEITGNDDARVPPKSE